MSNNTVNHVSDSSSYVLFDPASTQWPSTFKNVQQCLAAIGSWARIDVGLPGATTAVKGVMAIATQAEVNTGTDNTKAVTPLTLATRLANPRATQTVWGYTKYATDAESVTITNDTVSLTPRSLNYVFLTRRGTESIAGSSRLSTTAQATSGTDDTTSMTPLKVKQAISALVPVQADATETNSGLVRLATVAQVRAGTIRIGYAISPYTFARLNATAADMGVVRLATAVEVATGTDAAKVVTPATLLSTKGNAAQFGLVKLSDTLIAQANTALSSQAKVLSSVGSPVITGSLFENAVNSDNKYQTWHEVDNSVPVGVIVMTAFWSDHGNLMMCDGRALSTTTYSFLFSRIGYSYGGSGGFFNIPDMRGVAARCWDAGRGMDPNRGFATLQLDQIASHEHVLQLIYQNGGNIPSSVAGYELKGADKNDQRTFTPDSNYTRALAFGGNETRMKNLAVGYAIRVF